MAKVSRPRGKAAKRKDGNGKARRKRASAAEIAADVEKLQQNGVTSDEVNEFYQQLDEQHDTMEEEAAGHRGDINATYDRACDALGVNKESFTLLYQERRRMAKALKKAGKMGTVTRDSLMKLSQALGGGLGDYAEKLAKAEPQQQAEAE